MANTVSDGNLERVLQYLDGLYAAADSDQPYGELVRASDLFFFSQSGDQNLLVDADVALQALTGFRQHVDRLERLLEAKGTPQWTGDDFESALACFVVDTETLEVRGNGAAEHLFGRALPCNLSELDVSDESHRDISSLIQAAKSMEFQGVKTLRLSFDAHPDVLVARCSKTDGFSTHDDDALTLQFTVSFILWTKELLSFAATEFDLSDAEVEVLKELLSGSSQIEVAEVLGKSRETVKAQAKSILRKFNASNMGDVKTTALAYVFLGNRSRVDMVAAPITQSATQSKSCLMQVGQLRQVEVWEYGAPNGFPVLFWHGLMLGPFFSSRMVEAFRRAGLRIICVSRPGFGRSSPPTVWQDFNDTVTADAVSVADQLGLQNMAFWVHQAGISFACRAAGALQGRVLGAAMNGAGVPIQRHMLSKMNMTTRVAAATVLYAPKVLEMMLRHGYKSWRVKGPRQFYRQFFGANGVEQASLKKPDIARLFELGFLHTSAQVPEAMIWDGKSAMSDWSPAYANFNFPQHWIHGTEDQVLDASFVAAFLEEQNQAPPIIRKGFGTDLLYADFDAVFSMTRDFFDRLTP